MSAPARRPSGLTAIAIVLAVNGLASVAEAIVGFAAGRGPVAIVPAVIGLLLLHRAYGIWQLRRGAWLVTVGVLSLRAVFSILDLVLAQDNLAAWANVVIVMIGMLYLLQPGIRRYFTENRHGA